MRQLSLLGIASAFALTGLLAAALPVQAGLANMRAGLKTDLAIFAPGLDVDIDSLSDAQVAEINNLLYSDRSTGEIRSLIGVTLGDCVPILCGLTRRLSARN